MPADTMIRPIRSDADHEMAMAEVERLWGAKDGTPDGDRLEVLATLIEAYEAKRWPMDRPSPISAIEFRLEQQGLTRKDLEPFIGSRARVSEIMTGKRSLTLVMIRKLSAGLGIPADVLVGPPVT
jgi:HTH-type transcriptional regulator / antitoxin HigA